MASKFQEGVEVMIKKSSQYHLTGDETNPIGIKGKITRNDGSRDHNVYVKWDNGRTNVYNEHDLKIIKAPKVIDTALLAELFYKDGMNDVLEVDTECKGEVYFRTGEGEGEEFESEGPVVMLNRKQVKAVVKQLKAWLDNNATKA